MATFLSISRGQNTSSTSLSSIQKGRNAPSVFFDSSKEGAITCLGCPVEGQDPSFQPLNPDFVSLWRPIPTFGGDSIPLSMAQGLLSVEAGPSWAPRSRVHKGGRWSKQRTRSCLCRVLQHEMLCLQSGRGDYPSWIFPELLLPEPRSLPPCRVT